jgi:hypothetical protein
VCTICPFDFALGGSFAAAYASRLGSLFPQATSTAGTRPMARWIIGRKNVGGAAIAPSVTTKKGGPVHYRFAPQSAKLGIMAMHRNEAPYFARHRISICPARPMSSARHPGLPASAGPGDGPAGRHRRLETEAMNAGGYFALVMR